MKNPSPVQLVVVTGLSGSGKTSAIHALEDLGYFCVDNLPPVLLPGLLDLIQGADPKIQRLAVVMDIRERPFFGAFEEVLALVRERGVSAEVLFFEASHESLVRRFGQTRRPHPLARGRTLLEGIEAETQELSSMKRFADRVIDTTLMNIHQIRQYLVRLYGRGEPAARTLQIELMSFGYARGIPRQADLVLDVRFLPNPHYDAALRDLDGKDDAVQRAVLADVESRDLLDRCFGWLVSMVRLYEREDRAYLKVGFGCTGGKHRSVAVVSLLAERLRNLGYSPLLFHRDVGKERGGWVS